LGQLFRAGKEWGQESLETLRLNTSEFIQEESRDVPATAEIEEFYNEVDKLRLDFDRLQSRLERLESYIIKE
jgi:ubiquinone biosynthesis protein UbiJ